jgi:hypothetical protein
MGLTVIRSCKSKDTQYNGQRKNDLKTLHKTVRGEFR